MRQISLLVLFLSLKLKSNSQTNSSDTLRELNELKNIRSKLIEKKAMLQQPITYKQALIDSIQYKIEKIKETIKKLSPSTKKRGKEMRQLQHDLQEKETEVNEIVNQQAQDKEIMKKSSYFIPIWSMIW